MQIYIIDDWRRVVKRFWSFRLSIISALLGGAEVLVQLLQPPVPSGLFAGFAAAVSVASALSRVVAKPKAYEPGKD